MYSPNGFDAISSFPPSAHLATPPHCTRRVRRAGSRPPPPPLSLPTLSSPTRPGTCRLEGEYPIAPAEGAAVTFQPPTRDRYVGRPVTAHCNGGMTIATEKFLVASFSSTPRGGCSLASELASLRSRWLGTRLPFLKIVGIMIRRERGLVTRISKKYAAGLNHPASRLREVTFFSGLIKAPAFSTIFVKNNPTETNPTVVFCRVEGGTRLRCAFVFAGSVRLRVFDNLPGGWRRTPSRALQCPSILLCSQAPDILPCPTHSLQ